MIKLILLLLFLFIVVGFIFVAVDFSTAEPEEQEENPIFKKDWKVNWDDAELVEGTYHERIPND